MAEPGAVSKSTGPPAGQCGARASQSASPPHRLHTVSTPSPCWLCLLNLAAQLFTNAKPSAKKAMVTAAKNYKSRHEHGARAIMYVKIPATDSGAILAILHAKSQATIACGIDVGVLSINYFNLLTSTIDPDET
jgi:hypothetical protein